MEGDVTMVSGTRDLIQWCSHAGVPRTSDTLILHRVHFKLGQDHHQPIRGWEIISILCDIICNHFISLLPWATMKFKQKAP